MKTDKNTTELQQDTACPNGKTYKHSDITLLVGRTGCTKCKAYCGEESGFVYCDESKLQETPALKSSDGVLANATAPNGLVERLKGGVEAIIDGDTYRGKDSNLTADKIVKYILSTVTPKQSEVAIATLKSSEGLVEMVVNILYDSQTDSDEIDFESIAKKIISTITPTPETASEWEKGNRQEKLDSSDDTEEHS